MLFFLSIFLLSFLNVATCYRLGVQSKFSFRLGVQPNPFDKLLSEFREKFTFTGKTTTPIVSYANEIAEARSLLLDASLKKVDDSNVVVQNLLDLERYVT